MATIKEAATTRLSKSGSKWRARLLQAPTHGSSGYYPEETVRRDGPRTFPIGTQIYFDHPGRTEREDRPERSVRDLAGKISSTPVFEGDGLYADIDFYSWAAGVVEEMAGDIGLSIRASAEIVPGQVDGRATGVVSKLLEGVSVDLVTKAGAGGRLVTLLEAAQPVSEDLEEALVADVDTQLGHAVRMAYEDRERDVYVWVNSFDADASVVYFTIGGKTWAQPYERVDTVTLRLVGERVEVLPVTTYHPVNQAGVVEMKEAEMPNIEEARLAVLQEAETRVPVLESERDEAVKRAEAAEARVRQTEHTHYRTLLEAALKESKLHQEAVNRLRKELTLEADSDVPEDAEEAVESRIKEEVAYLAAVTPSNPAKRPLGFSSGGGNVTESAVSYTNPWGRTINPKEA